MPVTAFQVDIVKTIREAFDQLCFKYASADRHQYVNGSRVWVPWQKDPLEGATGWTTAVNTTLCRTGREHFGMGVGTNPNKVMPGTHLDYGEWLWDITWCEEGDKSRMVDLPLVAECEWALSSATIVEDFQKLLVARAGVRLMIHEHWTDREKIPDPPAMANHLSEHIQAYQRTQPGDVYLLVALDGTEPGAEYLRMRYFRLGTDGAAVEWVKGEPSPFVANEP